jgi:hypothetical protein
MVNTMDSRTRWKQGVQCWYDSQIVTNKSKVMNIAYSDIICTIHCKPHTREFLEALTIAIKILKPRKVQDDPAAERYLFWF